MSTPDPLNLSAICGEMPTGAEYAMTYYGSLSLTVEAVLSLTGPMRWAIRIEKPKSTASGRKGKPERVALIVCNDDQTIPDLLRILADAWSTDVAVSAVTS